MVNPKSEICNPKLTACGNERSCRSYNLAMAKTCPWCLEPLPVRSDSPECPFCKRPVGKVGEPQALALRCQRVEAAQTDGFRRMLTWGVPIAAAIAVVMPVVHIGALAVVPLMTAVHLVIVRVVLVRDAQRLLRPVRRLLNRWLARFAFLWIGLPGYGAMTIPVVGVVLGAGTFALLTTVVHVSTIVSLQRERTGRELALWEKLVPAVLATLTVALLALVIGLAIVFGWSVMATVDWIQGQ